MGAWIERIDPEQPETGLRFEYFELFGLEQLPDFDSLTPVSRGTVSRPDLSVRESDDHFAIRFFGYLAIEQAGQKLLDLLEDTRARSSSLGTASGIPPCRSCSRKGSGPRPASSSWCPS